MIIIITVIITVIRTLHHINELGPIVEKCATPKALPKALVDVSAVDLQVAFSILRMCGSYC